MAFNFSWSPLIDSLLSGFNSIVTALLNITTDDPVAFEDDSFVTGDSPVEHDVNTALGRNANNVEIICDGVGDIQVALSNDGSTFGSNITVKADETKIFENVSVDTIKVTWVADSAYRISAI